MAPSGVFGMSAISLAEVSDPCRDAMSQVAAGKKILGGGDL